MDYPKSEGELKSLLQQYADAGMVGMLDPRTRVDVTSTIVLKQVAASGTPWGVNGNYARLNWKGPRGQDLWRIEGVQGQYNRGFTAERFVLNGGGPDSNDMGARACLNLSAPLGDNGPLYKFLLRDIYTSSAQYGIILEGGVYEGAVDNCHGENHSKDGVLTRHLNLGAPGQGVVSNVLFIHPNFSRCFGAGMRLVYSCYVLGGSFILNGDGGIQAPDGIRGVLMSNGENTAGKDQSCFVVPNNGYGSVLNLCEASTDGTTRCRKWTGTAWEDVGSPMLYGLAAPSQVASADCHISYYGGGPNNTRWRK